MEIDNIVSESIDGEVFNFSDKLNEKIWDEDENLKPEIRKKLLAISLEYIKFLKLPKGVRIKDLTVTGSLAGYNYSKYSDVDVHIIIDYDDISTNHDFVAEYMGNKRKIWVDENEVTLYGYPLEMYCQNSKEYLEGSSPQYSLIKGKWLKKMDKDKPEVDKGTVIKKAKEMAKTIDSLEHNNHTEEVLEKLDTLSAKIKKMRKEGIEKEGEFSPENLVFKTLRNGGYLEKMNRIKQKALAKEYSVNEEK
jgi:hypothetical protein